MTDSWPMRCLAALADVGAGNPAPQSDASFVGGTVPFFRTSDVGRVHLGELHDAEDRLNEAGAKGMRLHPSGTVLLPKSGASTFTDHRVITSRPGYVSSHLATIKANGKTAIDRYLYYALQTISARDVAGDSSYPTLNLAQVKAIEIPAPPLTEQQRIVAILDQAFEAITAAVEKTSRSLAGADELLSTFRDRLLEGEKAWPCRPLGHTCKIKHGFAFESRYFTPSGDNVLLTPGNFYEHGGFRDRGKDQKRYQGPIPRDFVLSSGALLVAMTEQAAGLLGSPLIVPEGQAHLHNQRLGLVVPNAEANWDSRFFFHLFNTVSLRRYLHEGATGTKVRHTSPGRIETFEARVPLTRQEQSSVAKRIDAISDEKDALIAVQRRKLAALDELKQSLLARAFSGELTREPIAA